jgi:hypothetical protein
MMFGLYADGAAVAMHGEKIAPELAALGAEYEKFGEAIDKVIAVGPFAGLLTAVAPLVFQIMVNHDKLPAAPLAQFGVVPKEALEMQGKAAAMRQLKAAMEEQQKAEAEMVAIQREVHANNERSMADART